MRPSRRILALTTAATLWLATGAVAQEAATKDEPTMKDVFAEWANQITLTQSDVSLSLRSKPLLSWSNPIRRTPAGALYLWTHDGLPKAVACMYPSGKEIFDLEFQSLAEDTMTATSSGGTVLWQPNEAGIEWTKVVALNPPGKSPFGRLRQMRLIAREFSAALVPPNKNPIQLRLLDTPLYRYERDASETDEILDGAIFSFVQGTDPEVLILVEAVRGDEKPEWRYAIARMSMVPTKVNHNDVLVWETTWPIQRTYTPYYTRKSFGRGSL